MVVDPMLLEPEITVASVGESTQIVSVQGELDVGAADEFRSALGDNRGDASAVVVDLVEATFIDSSALGVISAAAKTAKRAGGNLTVVATDPRILRIFTLTGLDRSIRVERSLADAIAHALV